MFIDELTITVKSGAGGRGCESYHRRPDRKRVPNGGDGGSGGSIIVRADAQTGSLFLLKSKRIFEAEAGGFGMGNNKYGRNGEDFVVRVPCGTTVYNKTEKLLIRDLSKAGEELVILKGGKGGYGNHNDRPATFGEEIKELELLLSFKIPADIFLVGLPNSGKTLFLKQLTGAGVSEAAYPFATKAPQLGTYGTDASQFRMCELPAVYQASHEGGGLGAHYLKHLERARIIFFFLDPKSEFAPDLVAGFDVLREAVRQFNPDFLKVPRFLVVNKIDMVSGNKISKNQLPKDEKCFLISAKDGTGVSQLMKAATQLLEKSHASSSS